MHKQHTPVSAGGRNERTNRHCTRCKGRVRVSAASIQFSEFWIAGLRPSLSSEISSWHSLAPDYVAVISLVVCSDFWGGLRRFAESVAISWMPHGAWCLRGLKKCVAVFLRVWCSKLQGSRWTSSAETESERARARVRGALARERESKESEDDVHVGKLAIFLILKSRPGLKACSRFE